MKTNTIIAIFLSLVCALSLGAQNAINFDGINDYISTNVTGVSGTGARTIEARIRTTANSLPPANGGTGQKVIVDWGGSANGQRFTFNLLWSNAIRLEVAGNGVSGTIPVNDGLWHHVACVYNPAATNTISLYVDGVLDIAGTPTVAINTSATNILIGRRIDNTSFFEGDIDEVRVWNVVRTQTELQANMNNEICNLSSSLILYCPLNQGTAGGTNTGLTAVSNYGATGGSCTLNAAALTGATSNWVSGYTYGPGFIVGATTPTLGCGFYTWSANGQTYTSPGIYSASIPSTAGCDSVVSINLTFSSNSASTQFVSQCGPYTWPVNGQTYTTSGAQSAVIPNAAGCDSSITLNLTILPVDSIVQTVNSCGPFLWSADSIEYATSGTYTASLTNAAGCDSILTLNLTVSPFNLTVANPDDSTLISNQTGATYQWINCATLAPIAGATNQTFVASTAGNYAVVVSTSSCSDTSDCTLLAEAAITENAISEFSLYPNPSEGTFVLTSSFPVSGTVSIIDAQGKTLQVTSVDQSSKLELNIEKLNNGLYFVQIQAESGSETLRILKK